MKVVHVIDFEHEGRRYLQQVERHGLHLVFVGGPVLAPPRGLGDTIAALTTSVGITPCAGCKGRRDALNRLLPYSTD